MIEFSNTNMVVVTNDLSSIRFSHEFLVAQKIASDNWTLVETPITTPVLSLVKYQNGYQFLVEGNKIQITFSEHGQSAEKTTVGESLQTLISNSFQPYIAVGINALAFLPHNSPKEFVLDRFFNQKLWRANNFQGAAIILAYQIDDFLLRLNLDAGEHKADTQIRTGIVINANFHLDIPKNITMEESKQTAIIALQKAPKLYSDLRNLLNNVLLTKE